MKMYANLVFILNNHLYISDSKKGYADRLVKGVRCKNEKILSCT